MIKTKNIETIPLYSLKSLFLIVAGLAMSALSSADVILRSPADYGGQRTILATSSVATSYPIVLNDVPNQTFKIGEKLKFIIKYQFIGAGTATMVINEGPLINGRETIHLESKADSNKFIDKFFKVRDVNSSIIDKRSLASLLFHQNLREGHYHVMRNTALDYQAGTYHFERVRKGIVTKDTGTISQPLQDMLSAFFYTRTLPLELGKDYSVTVFSDKEVYDLKVKVYPKLQNISVPAGKFECMRIEPVLIGDAIFKAKEGKMTIWLTNDSKRMPVLLRSKVFIGAVDAELMEYTLGE